MIPREQILKSLKECNLLYVEDDATIIFFFKTKFKSFFKSIIVAEDGEIGLKSFLANDIDIIITDIMMPNMDGLIMLEHIENEKREIIKLIITGYDDSRYLQKAIKLGIDGYITKPYSDEEFLETLIKSYEKMYLKKMLIENQKLMLAQSRQAAIGEMISAIAHQWRQPLNAVGAILHNIETAQIFGKLTEDKLSSNIKKAQSQIQFMSQTIENFRNFFKPKKNIERFCLLESINETISLVMEKLKNENINLSINGEKNGCGLYGYKNDFMQVILNLILNARDAIIQNRVKNGSIDIDISKNNGYFTVSVSDNGGGIDEAIVDKIFEPYFTTKDENIGNGIGLYMSKMIIEKNMDGKLGVKNIENGASFYICLKDSNE